MKDRITTVQNGSNLVIYYSSDRLTWFLGTCESSLSDTIRSDETLGSGQRLTSNNNCYHIDMQGDGNLVIYSAPDMVPRNPIWSSNTYNKSPYKPFRLMIQDNGNLVMYDTHNRAVWASNTERRGSSLYHLVMQNHGSLAIYDANNHCTWTSDTNH